jgi:hypothetical protein
VRKWPLPALGWAAYIPVATPFAVMITLASSASGGAFSPNNCPYVITGKDNKVTMMRVERIASFIRIVGLSCLAIINPPGRAHRQFLIIPYCIIHQQTSVYLDCVSELLRMRLSNTQRLPPRC